MKYQGLIFLLLFTRLKTIESAEPVINNAINEIKVSYCSTQEYKLDANAYSDAEDGNLVGGKLTLKLLDASAATFVPNDEKPVQLVGTSLFIVPVSTTQSELNLILRVMDTSGSFKDDRFKVTFNNKISVREISFHFTLSKVTTGDVQIQDLFNFYQALKELTTWKTRNFGLSEITNVADKKKEVAVFDCGMTQSTCPLQTILNLINDVKDQNPGPTYTLNFDSKMAAIDLQASGFRWEKFDRCIGVSGVPDRDINLEFWSFAGIQAIDRTQVIQVEIPDGGFTYESIKQSTMTLEIQSGRNDPTIAFDNFWIGAELEGSKWIIYAVRTDRFYEYISLTGNFFEHKGILYAQVFVSASVLLPISVERNDYYMSVENTTKPMNNYIVEFSVGITGIAKHIYPKQINIFLSKLFVTFGTSYKELIYVNDYVIESFDGRNGDGVIRWSLMMDKCEFDRIEFIRSKMFESGSQEEINNDFKLRMKREYDLRSIKETLSGDCNLSKPKQSSPIGPYQISYCGINSFKLADDTFIDEEDGNLAKLTAKMTTEQNKPIGSDDIIQFDDSN
ncbi:uncharacterized protein [Clytia hemisphaerica]|uniref:uncharacterized protein n=1 Tax=Clytia hemisphaerica TaxID=252671 RepID=UPI0034D68677